jgi:hypothetical protein
LWGETNLNYNTSYQINVPNNTTKLQIYTNISTDGTTGSGNLSMLVEVNVSSALLNSFTLADYISNNDWNNLIYLQFIAYNNSNVIYESTTLTTVS